RGRHDRLDPNAHHAPGFLAHDRGKAHEVDSPEVRRGGAPGQGCFVHADRRSCLSLSCTSRMNSSSSRFVFVRMLATCSDSAESWANTSFSPCPFATSTSISCSFRSRVG